MPKGYAASLFISSTCFDLSQVRADLADFATSLGFEPVLSELDSFPVNPAQDTLANCLEVVRTKADIFVLIVGGRYGSLTETGRSVTNLEFLEATARGIPRYIFIKREIIALLPTWRENPTANFSATVDNPKLFEFVSSLRDSGDLWVFPFDSAQDIPRTLRKQLSYLFADSLDVRGRLIQKDSVTLQLGPLTLRAYTEHAVGWEYLTFARALKECMATHVQKQLDYELGISFGAAISFSDNYAAATWVQGQATQLQHLVTQLSIAVNQGLVKAAGPPGKPGEIARIWHLALRIGDAYAALLDWALQFNRLVIEDDLKRLMDLARGLSALIISTLENFAETLYAQVTEALRAPDAAKKISLELALPDVSEFIGELKRVYGSD